MSNWQSTPGPSSYPANYGAPQGATPPSSSRKPWLWIALGVGGLAGLCCCGGTIGAVMFGMNMGTSEVASQLRDNPKFRENIGELQTINKDWTQSGAADDDQTFLYKVKGNKGSGTITVKQMTDDDGNEVVIEAMLRLSDGKQVQIVP